MIFYDDFTDFRTYMFMHKESRPIRGIGLLGKISSYGKKISLRTNWKRRQKILSLKLLFIWNSVGHRHMRFNQQFLVIEIMSKFNNKDTESTHT